MSYLNQLIQIVQSLGLTVEQYGQRNIHEEIYEVFGGFVVSKNLIKLYGVDYYEEQVVVETLLHEVGHYIYKEWREKDLPKVEREVGWAIAQEYLAHQVEEEGFAEGFKTWAIQKNTEEFKEYIKMQNKKKKRGKEISEDTKIIGAFVASLLFLFGSIAYRVNDDINTNNTKDPLIPISWIK